MFAKKDNPKHVFDCIAVNSLTAITLGDFIDDISEELKDSNINENDIYLSVQSVKHRPLGFQQIATGIQGLVLQHQKLAFYLYFYY